MKKFAKAGAVMAGVVLVMGGLVGCGSGGSPENDDRAGETSNYLYERTVELKDGREISCIVYKQYNTGGLSCDWTGAEAR